jgi:glucosamine 6-phosphate synthetase-like amidotransferase/phosphosugar isomerase protein
VVISACGTAWHAGLIGEYVIEELARLNVEVEYASEFRYRNPIIGPADLMVVISQSGETADTLAALREAKTRGARVMGVCNVVGSTIAREAGMGIYTHAGPEIGVASTKAFTTQIATMIMLAITVGPPARQPFAAGSQRIGPPAPGIPDRIAEVCEQSMGLNPSPNSIAKTATSSIWGGARVSDRPRRRPQTQGNFLHPRRGLPGGRDETRPHRPGRREHAGGRPGQPRRRL